MGLFDAIGGVLGMGTDNNAQWQATRAQYDQPNTSADLGLSDVNQSMGNQNAFLAALQAQGGIGNQASVFNQQQGLLGQQQGTIGQQQGLLGQQQGLANQLGMQARGYGPNPALAQLAQTTGQNMQQQAALMASQRGGGTNPALLSRMAAQQGGALQQQAGGQAAVMRAQQQLAAQQALGQQQQAMGQTLGQVGGQQMNMGQIGANMGNIAAQQVGQQQNALSEAGQMAQNNYNMQLGARGQYGAQLTAMESNMNNANSGMAQSNAGFQQKLTGGLINKIPLIGGAFSQGGVVGGPKSLMGRYASGGMIQPAANPGNALMNVDLNIPKGMITQQSGGSPSPGNLPQQPPPGGTMLEQSNAADLAGFSPEAIGGAGAADLVELAPLAVMASKGGKVNGTAKVKGDSPVNDTVDAKLSPGEIVIPRSAINDPHKIAAFLNHLLGINLMVGGK